MTRIVYLDFVPQAGGGFRVDAKLGSTINDGQINNVRMIAHRVQKEGLTKKLRKLWSQDVDPSKSNLPEPLMIGSGGSQTDSQEISGNVVSTGDRDGANLADKVCFVMMKLFLQVHTIIENCETR
jgi:hypothetical protein